MRHLLLAALIVQLGCGSSGAGKIADASGTGGGGQDGGGTDTSASTGGASGTGGSTSTETSPGTTTVRLALAPGLAYCDQGSTCDPFRHIAIRTAAGQTLPLAPGGCPTWCDTCQPPACPGFACVPTGRETRDEELVWDGSYYESSTCGTPALQCARKRFARPGQYVAVMCAKEGRLEQPDSGTSVNPICRATASDPSCVEVPFTFPSTTPVVGRLSPSGMPVRCGAASCSASEVCVNPCCGGAAPPCQPAPDGGACPAGAYGCVVTPGGRPGCATPCTPPPPFCQPASSALPAGCTPGKDRQVSCVCA
jgi:hypothetical protein